MRVKPLLLITTASAMALLAACGSSEPSATDTDALAAREAELQQREAELAQREAALEEPSAPTASAPKPAPAAKPVAATRPATTAAAPKPAATPKPVAAPKVITVPAGTELALSLATPLTTKTAKVGDVVRATVVSDVLVDGRTAIAQGSTVAGQVIQVVSGSDKIGGVPTLAVHFDRLELPGGHDAPLTGDITQSGKSDTGRDTAKIVGGAAAGALIGHEVKGGDKGTVIGGLVGGAIGAVAAKKTGTEVKLDEGTALTLVLGAPMEVTKP